MKSNYDPNQFPADQIISNAVTVDANGYVYTTGQFRGTVDFDPGPGVYNLSTQIGLNIFAAEIFVTKFDPSGNFVWAKQIAGVMPPPNSTVDDAGRGISVDTSGNVLITGNFRGTNDFDPGPGVYNLNSATVYLPDIFILKLDASGNFVWAKQFGSTFMDEGYSIAVDATGNIYTTGYFYLTVDFDPGPGVYNLTSTGGFNTFISKLDAAGNFVMAKQIGAASSATGRSITLDAAGNIYTTGNFFITGDFDPGPGTYNLTALGDEDIFVLKLDPSGDFLWARQMGGANTFFGDEGTSIAVDAAGNVYTTGFFSGTCDFDPGPGVYTKTALNRRDAFVSKLDAGGNFVWAAQFGGTGSWAYDDMGYVIKVDANSNVYTIGYFNGTVDFDPGPGTYYLSSPNVSHLFISKLDNSGNFVWATDFILPNYLGDFTGYGFDIDSYQNFFITGYFNGTADFDPGPGVYNMTSTGDKDVYVAKYSQTCTQIPTITTFTPTSGPMGTTVTITGTNFDPTPTNNIVYFGATRATVSAATATSLTVSVPIGATYQPITVTNPCSLTAYSAIPFIVTFPCGGVIDPGSFAAAVIIPSPNYYDGNPSLGDIDGDGKPDFVVCGGNQPNYISVFRNLSSVGSISFAPYVSFALGTGTSVVKVGDLDGDGKLDLAVRNQNSAVSILRNTSSPGTIAFAPKMDFATNADPKSIAIGDLDGDGKPDLAVVNGNDTKISILKNISIPGSIAFAPKMDITKLYGQSGVSIDDLDRDGKPDLIIGGGYSFIAVLKNTSTIGSISFAPVVNFTCQGNDEFLIGDLDGDGKLDFSGLWANSDVSVLRNLSTPGTISFAPEIIFPAIVGFHHGFSQNDIDGDGKPDLAVAGYDDQLISVLKNTSTPGTISFAPNVYYATEYYPFGLSLGDFDGDGKPEMTYLEFYGIKIRRNTVIGLVVPSVNITASSTTICTGTSVTFTATPTNGGTTPFYQWQVNGTNVGTNAPTYSSSALVNGDIVKVIMTSNANCASPTTATSNSITMTVTATVAPTVGITASATTICSGANVTFTATPTNGGSAPSYQWQVNGVNVGTNAPTYATSALVNGDVVNVIMTSNLSCASPTSATSNTISMTVNPNVTPAVNITANPPGAVCAGTSVTFTATPTNGGSTPAYQWKVNGINVGTNAATYNTASLVNGDIVNVIMTSNANCALPTTATSNSITMQVNPILVPAVNISANPPGTICSGTSVTFTALPTNGGSTPSYQWRVNGTNAGTNSSTFTTAVLANGDIVDVILTSNATCATPVTATSNAITMNITATLTPSVTINASATTICAGTSVTFTAAPTNGGATPSYQWKVNGINAGTNSPLYTTNTLANGDLVTVVMTSGLACASPASAISNTITMVVNPNVTPGVNITANPSGAVCAGTSVTFTATASNTAGGTTNYDFKVNGVSVQNGASNTFTNSTLANGNTITCDITIAGGNCLTSTSASSNTITMTVNPNLTPIVNITANPPGNICSGTPVTFTATANNTGGGTLNYDFKVNGSSVQNGAANTFTSSTLVNGNNITCDITVTGGNCMASPTATSNAITMNVTTTVIPAVGITASATTICSGTSVTFTAIPVNGGTAPSYQWQVNGVNVGTNTPIYSTSALVNGDIVKVILTSNANCASPTTATSNSIAMAVNPNITPSVNISANPSGPVCIGSSVFFTASATNPSGGTVTYTFKVNGTSVQNGTSNTYTSTTLANGNTVSCDINITGGSCLTTPSASSNTITMSISSPPLITITANPAGNICAGTPVNFTALPLNTGTNPTFQWKLNGINVGINSPTYSSSTLADGDQVNCVLNTVSICSATPDINSNTIMMAVKPIPVISFNPNNPTIFSGNFIQLNAQVNTSVANYLWTPSTGLNNPAISNPIANPTNTMVYKLAVNSTDNCHVEKNITVTVIKEVYLPNSFTPNGDGINDIFRVPPGIIFTLQYFVIYDRYGNEIFRTTDINKGWDGTYKGAKSPNGTYTYLIKGSNSKREILLNGTVLIIR